jgi:hypothetical protein
MGLPTCSPTRRSFCGVPRSHRAIRAAREQEGGKAGRERERISCSGDRTRNIPLKASGKLPASNRGWPRAYPKNLPAFPPSCCFLSIAKRVELSGRARPLAGEDAFEVGDAGGQRFGVGCADGDVAHFSARARRFSVPVEVGVGDGQHRARVGRVADQVQHRAG